MNRYLMRKPVVQSLVVAINRLIANSQWSDGPEIELYHDLADGELRPALQIPVLTPADPARHGASVCVPSPRAQEIVREMGEQGVLAWNGQGRVRVSFHGYNTTHDVDRATAALRAAWK